MRPLWSGSIAFGLVNVPIKLYSATVSDHGVNLDMLHKSDLSPIRYARICKADGKEVAWKDIVKGYEIGDGQYVPITEADLKQASSKKSSAIEIDQFVAVEEIDSVYFDKPYYLTPDKGAARAFNLLRQALEKSKKVGVAKFVFRNREHLVIIKPYYDLLVLNQLRFQEEIRSIADFDLPEKEKVTAREMEMAIALVNQLTQEFDPSQYKDTYTAELRDMIKNKSKGKLPVPKAAKAAKPTKVVDLFETLKASLKPTKEKRQRRSA